MEGESKTKKPRSVLSDELSYAINDLTEELSASSLWDDEAFRNAILSEALPKQLQKAIGLDVILTRVPANYLRAILAASWPADSSTKRPYSWTICFL